VQQLASKNHHNTENRAVTREATDTELTDLPDNNVHNKRVQETMQKNRYQTVNSNNTPSIGHHNNRNRTVDGT
jgi:hypothetical protein